MCGIVGYLNLKEPPSVVESQVRKMLAAIRHRGPDQFGIYLDGQVALGSARLSIVDLNGGQQPIPNEDETLWIVFNGEIFNYRELRPGLEARGHRFATETDTEVLLHLYEEYGASCLDRLNGQFAFAIWDTRSKCLFLARDRLGVRPLFYTSAGGSLIFGSEIKAILTDPRVRAEIDPVSIDQIFTFWSTLTPRTVFRNIYEVPPGHYMVAKRGTVHLQRYWQLGFSSPDESAQHPTGQYLEEFRELLTDATRLRLRADVPVGAYLSGGLDSSTIAALIRNVGINHLDTFSVSFCDPHYDESKYQRRMASFLGTDHQVVSVTHEDIGRVFPDVIWHTEMPVMRTSPAPMFLLSQLAHDRGYKVVLTGEGADELLGGYDIFKEAAIRRFWARQPESTVRPRLFERLYADIPKLSSVNRDFLAAFFKPGLGDVTSASYSHAIRWRNNRRTRRFFSQDLLGAVDEQLPEAPLTIPYPAGFSNWRPLERAQYLESSLFLSQYLLSSQGDRMAMAHSVEGRFPFLDHRVVDFCSRLPPNLKLNGLKEKYLLKLLAGDLLPKDISNRAKRPYRAPIHRAFFNETTPDYVRDLLSPSRLKDNGLFNPTAVGALVDKLNSGAALGETDDMSLVGIVSSQLVVEQFIRGFQPPPALDRDDRIKLHVGGEIAQIQ
jgi:asparagine synthase (glutamine-hydrolysing)